VRALERAFCAVGLLHAALRADRGTVDAVRMLAIAAEVAESVERLPARVGIRTPILVLEYGMRLGEYNPEDVDDALELLGDSLLAGMDDLEETVVPDGEEWAPRSDTMRSEPMPISDEDAAKSEPVSAVVEMACWADQMYVDVMR
jgi:hypothetical protein